MAKNFHIAMKPINAEDFVCKEVLAASPQQAVEQVSKANHKKPEYTEVMVLRNSSQCALCGSKTEIR